LEESVWISHGYIPNQAQTRREVDWHPLRQGLHIPDIIFFFFFSSFPHLTSLCPIHTALPRTLRQKHCIPEVETPRLGLPLTRGSSERVLWVLSRTKPQYLPWGTWMVTGYVINSRRWKLPGVWASCRTQQFLFIFPLPCSKVSPEGTVCTECAHVCPHYPAIPLCYPFKT
jgi:hypothetical protein